MWNFKKEQEEIKFDENLYCFYEKLFHREIEDSYNSEQSDEDFLTDLLIKTTDMYLSYKEKGFVPDMRVMLFEYNSKLITLNVSNKEDRRKYNRLNFV